MGLLIYTMIFYRGLTKNLKKVQKSLLSKDNQKIFFIRLIIIMLVKDHF